MTKKKKRNLPIDPDETLVFESQEEFDQWLKDNDITEEDFLESGGTVRRVTVDDNLENVNNIIKKHNSDNPGKRIGELSSEQLEAFFELPEEDRYEYLESLIKGLN